MEVSGQVSGIEQARMCLDAMPGQDEETKRSLWRAALKYRQRDLAGSTGYGSSRARSRASLPAWVQFTSSVGERAECLEG